MHNKLFCFKGGGAFLDYIDLLKMKSDLYKDVAK